MICSIDICSLFAVTNISYLRHVCGFYKQISDNTICVCNNPIYTKWIVILRRYYNDLGIYCPLHFCVFNIVTIIPILLLYNCGAYSL